MADVRFDQFVDGGEMQVGDIPVGLRSSDMANNYKFNFPGTGIKDSNGNYLLRYESAGLLAVNYLSLINSLSGNDVVITAGGSDPNIGLKVIPIGTGPLTLGPVKWVTADGVPNSFIYTDGLGQLHFTAGGSVVTSIIGTNNQVYANGTFGIPENAIVTLTLPQDINTTSSPTFDAPIFTAPVLGTPASGILTNCTGLPLTTGVVGILLPGDGGTGINNGTSTLTLDGSLTTSGAFTSTFVMTGNTNVTFPTSGTLATTSELPTPSPLTEVNDTNVTMTLGGTPATALLQSVSMTLGWTGQLSLARGGTNASLTASNGGIVYSTATGLAILPSVSSATLLTSITGIPVFSSHMLDGQVIIGQTTGTPVAANLTPGANITITNGPGSITIAAAGSGITPSPLTEINDTNVTMFLGGTPGIALLRPVSMTLGWTGQLSLARGGTNANLTASNGGIVYSTATGLAILSSTTSATLVTDSSGIPTFTSSMTNGQIVIGSTGNIPVAATLIPGANITITNSPGSITIAASGGASVTPSPLTEVNDTNVTMTLGGTPATALLQSVSMTLGWAGQLSLARGGTNASLTASNGGIVYSTATGLAILPSVSSATLLTSITGIPVFSSHMLDGQVIIGQTTGTPVAANLTPGANITITNGPGSITIAASGGASVTPSPLTEVNDTNVTMTLGGTPATALLQSVSMTLGWTGQLGLTRGGTNASLTASNGSVVYSTASALALTSPLTNGQLVIGSTGTAPVTAILTAGPNVTITNGPGSIIISSTGGGGGVTPFPLTSANDTNVTITLGGTPAVSLLSAVSLTMGWTGQLGLTRGGTNASLTASNGSVVYSTASALALTSPLTNGQLVIGSTGGAPATAILTAGANITITNGPGSITIASTGGGGGVTPSPLTEVNDTNVTMTLGGTPATALLQSVSMTLGWTGQLSLARGGTNASLTASNGGIVYSTATGLAILPSVSGATLLTSLTGIPVFSSHMLNGQVIIGQTTGTPVAANLTAGANITITNAPGSITIASTGGLLNVQVFETSGTYTPTPGMTDCVIQCVGGGGAGGGAPSNATSASGAGGGGSGGFSQSYVTSATIGASKAVTIGAGGTGVSNGAGNAGGNTSVGSIVIALGGSGAPVAGAIGAFVQFYIGAPGGAAGTGNINSGGGPGGYGCGGSGVTQTISGVGGNSVFGGGASSVSANSSGNNAIANSGGGGSGGASFGGGGNQAGGNGASGIVIIYEYS